MFCVVRLSDTVLALRLFNVTYAIPPNTSSAAESRARDDEEFCAGKIKMTPFRLESSDGLAWCP